MSNNLLSMPQTVGICFFLILVSIYLVSGFTFASQIQAPTFDFPELPSLFPKYSSHEIMGMYNTPADLQKAIDNGEINYKDIPDNIKKQVRPCC